MLDGEQIAMIYEYIAIKSHVNNPFAQIRLCREFSTKQIRNMREGYCLVTLELALNQLIMAPELICMDEHAEKGMFEESEQNWRQRSQSITNSFRQSLHAQNSNHDDQSKAFNLQVPQNILAPKLQKEKVVAQEGAFPTPTGGSAYRKRRMQSVRLPFMTKESKRDSSRADLEIDQLFSQNRKTTRIQGGSLASSKLL